MAGTGFVCERWQQPFDDPSRNWWNSTQSSQEDAMNIFVAAIERVVSVAGSLQVVTGVILCSSDTRW